AVTEEPQRKDEHDRHEDEELRPGREPEHSPQHEEAAESQDGGRRVIDVDRADEVALRSLVPEPAEGARVGHPEPAAEERRRPAAGTAQTDRPTQGQDEALGQPLRFHRSRYRPQGSALSASRARSWPP